MKSRSDFDQYQDNYNDLVNGPLSFSGLKVDFFTQVKADYIGDISKNHFTNKDNLEVLDIGCGVGNIHPLIRNKFRSLTGIEVSSACIERARKSNKDVTYLTYNGRVIPFNQSSFDLVYTICVMHHVAPQHWESFIGEMQRVLRPNGLAVIFEHNPLNPVTMRVVNNCEFDKKAVLLPGEKMQKLLGNAGLRDVKTRYILSVPAKGKVLRSLDKLFSRLPFGAQYYAQGTK